MIAIQRERAHDLWDEAQPLLAAHWREIAHYQDIELAPDRALYEAAEDVGSLRCYSAREGEALIGYVVFFVRHAPHYRHSLQAVQDVLFVLPEHRKGMAGVRLIKHAEDALQAEGVQVVYHHAKRTNLVGRLLGRLGYDLVEEIYCKRLDK